MILALLLLSLGTTAQTDDRFRVTLLGTGTPRPIKDELVKSSHTRSILAHHTTAPEAATIFRATEPKLAVCSHIVLRGAATAREVSRETRRTYDGKVVIGSDLMTIDVVTRRVVSSSSSEVARSGRSVPG